MPLHLSLLGLSGGYLRQRQESLARSLRSHPLLARKSPESYTLLSQNIHGGVAIFVYGRDDTVGSRLASVENSSAACGIFNVLGNKAAVGVRVTLKPDEDSKQGEEEVYTFVSAHLAAHDHGLQRRNSDFRTIVQRLLFPSSSDSSRLHTIYDTSHLFLMGDLNYRLSLSNPTSIRLPTLSHKIHFSRSSLVAHDTLLQEQGAGRVLQGLREGEITFQPTYKYKANKGNTYKDFRKRIPGWTDRVFFASWNDVDAREGSRRRARVELYRAVQRYCGSDHKPVTAIISIPSPSKKNPPSGPLRLPTRAPYAPDKGYRTKLLVGKLLDRIVGIWMLLIVLIGFGKLKLGIVNAIVATLAAAWYFEVLGKRV